MSRSFFADLPAVHNFGDLFDPSVFAPLPRDWLLVITDVQGSTAAIQAGQYRAVNLVGAASIIAMTNISEGLALPYVFGGDGATLALPPELWPKAERALQGVVALAQREYGLKLRVGKVAVAELEAAGQPVRVARYCLSGEDCIAMFWGEGMTHAENLVKAPNSSYQIHPPAEPPEVDLNGLSCRWEPFRPEQGRILSLLVKSREPDGSPVYREVFDHMMRVAGGEQPAANPVKLAGMKKERLLPSALGLELSLYKGLPMARRLLTTALNLVDTVIGNILFMIGRKTPALDPELYISSTVARSDFRKFDGMLRMVVEEPLHAQADIEAYLERLYKEGRIYYGHHWSETAVMTCVLFSLSENRHIHFVDGGDGGYALAAVGLKAQLKKG